MKGFAAITRGEIHERRYVLAAAALASLIPFADPLVRSFKGADASEARQWTALILAATFGAVIAFGLGLTVIARDIADRRIAFYFSRPASGWEIWAGKLTAAWLLALFAAAIVLFPTWAIDRFGNLDPALPHGTFALAPFAILVIVVVGHAVGIVSRPRNGLLFADMLVVAGGFLMLNRLSLPLYGSLARNAIRTNFSIGLAGLATGLIAGGWAAVATGRTSALRAHWALSRILWTTIAGTLAVVGAHDVWVLRARPGDVKVDFVDPKPHGWLALSGQARGDFATFLVNATDGRFRRTQGLLLPPSVSADAGRAVWFEPQGPKGPWHLLSWNLRNPEAKPQPTRIVMKSAPAFAFLSADGTRVATYDLSLLSVYDVESGSLVSSARIPGNTWGRGLFLDRDVVRVYTGERVQDEYRWAIFEFDVAARKLRRTGAMPYRVVQFAVSPDGSRILGHDDRWRKLLLIDGQKGTVQRSLLEEAQANVEAPSASFLSDGRVAAGSGGGPAQLLVFSSDGRSDRTWPLGEASTVRVLGEPAPGMVVVFLPSTKAVAVVNVETGGVSRLPNLRPLPRSFWLDDFQGARPGYDIYLQSPSGSVLRLDPATASLKPVLETAR